MKLALIIAALCAVGGSTVAVVLCAIFAAGMGTCACGCDEGDHNHYGHSGQTYCCHCGPETCARYRPAGRRHEDEAMAVANSGRLPTAVARRAGVPPPPPSPIIATEVRYRCGCWRRIDAVGELRGARYCKPHSPFVKWESELNEAQQ